MDLVVYAVPFFILAIFLELAWGHRRRRNTFRLNDSVGSLFMGVMSQARRFLTLGVGAYVYYLITAHFSLELMDASHWWTWVLAMVLYDFCYYWLHRFGHEYTILWAAHVAHHQSEDYNLTTALRQTSTGFLLGWIFYIPMFLLGIPAEVVVTVGSLNLIYQFWVHTEHVGKLGWYEWIFVTPSNHRVHHAQNDVYLDRNYGGLFIFWDRLFGTFQEELETDPPIFGIRGPLKSFNPITANTHIYLGMIQDSWRTANWSDKLRVWFSRTGWRPADVALAWPREKTNLDDFHKFDPAVPRLVGWYALFQLVAVVLLLGALQWSTLDRLGGWLGWAMLLMTTVTTARWLEGHSGTQQLRWEGLRLLAGGFCLAYAWATGAPSFAIVAGVVYVGLNLFWLPLLVGRAVAGAEAVHQA
ncbi:MAG: sterol desaturase family protein [Pseudomonadota bacterium]